MPDATDEAAFSEAKRDFLKDLVSGPKLEGARLYAKEVTKEESRSAMFRAILGELPWIVKCGATNNANRMLCYIPSPNTYAGIMAYARQAKCMTHNCKMHNPITSAVSAVYPFNAPVPTEIAGKYVGAHSVLSNTSFDYLFETSNATDVPKKKLITYILGNNMDYPIPEWARGLLPQEVTDLMHELKEIIKTCWNQLASGNATAPARIDVYTPQLLVPFRGETISVSPVPCQGVMVEIGATISAIEDRRRDENSGEQSQRSLFADVFPWDIANQKKQNATSFCSSRIVCLKAMPPTYNKRRADFELFKTNKKAWVDKAIGHMPIGDARKIILELSQDKVYRAKDKKEKLSSLFHRFAAKINEELDKMSGLFDAHDAINPSEIAHATLSTIVEDDMPQLAEEMRANLVLQIAWAISSVCEVNS